MIEPPLMPRPPRGEVSMVRVGELMMILELHSQGVSITAIARRTGRDPKTIRKYIERGIEAPRLWAAFRGKTEQVGGLSRFPARARDRLSGPERRAADPRDPRAWLCRCLYRGEALSRRHPSAERPQAQRGAL